MKPSLLRRMLLAQALVMAGLWALNSGILLTWTAGRMVPSDLDLPLKRQAETLLAVLEDEKDPSRFCLHAHRIQEVAENHSPYRSERGRYRSVFQVLDAQGSLLFRSDAAPRSVMTPAGPGRYNLALDGATWRVVVLEGANLRVLVAETQATRWNAAKADILRRTPVAYAIMFLGIALFTWVASRVALKPFRRLAEAVEARNPGDLSPLEGHADLRETRPLVTALNRLFQRIQDLLETQRRFVADAAHELRTPLTVISTQAHVLSTTQDPDRRAWAERELQLGIERGAQVVGQLLSVARMEALGQTPEWGPLDLAALAQERMGSLVSKALAKGQDLGYEGPGTLPWKGDAAVIGSAVDNLLVNAIHFTPPGSTITLRLSRKPGETVLEVEDDGPGIPAEFRDTILDRFTRVPGTQEPGSGLGLAIVRGAAELHGGGVELAGRPGGPGLRVTLRFPG